MKTYVTEKGKFFRKFQSETRKKYMSPPYCLNIEEANKRTWQDWYIHKQKLNKKSEFISKMTNTSNLKFPFFDSVDVHYHSVLEGLIKNAVYTTKMLTYNADGFAIGITTYDNWKKFVGEILEKTSDLKQYFSEKIKNIKIVQGNSILFE